MKISHFKWIMLVFLKTLLLHILVVWLMLSQLSFFVVEVTCWWVVMSYIVVLLIFIWNGGFISASV